MRIRFAIDVPKRVQAEEAWAVLTANDERLPVLVLRVQIDSSFNGLLDVRVGIDDRVLAHVLHLWQPAPKASSVALRAYRTTQFCDDTPNRRPLRSAGRSGRPHLLLIVAARASIMGDRTRLGAHGRQLRGRDAGYAND